MVEEIHDEKSPCTAFSCCLHCLRQWGSEWHADKTVVLMLGPTLKIYLPLKLKFTRQWCATMVQAQHSEG
jgi:hypothetical protein